MYSRANPAFSPPAAFSRATTIRPRASPSLTCAPLSSPNPPSTGHRDPSIVFSALCSPTPAGASPTSSPALRRLPFVLSSAGSPPSCFRAPTTPGPSKPHIRKKLPTARWFSAISSGWGPQVLSRLDGRRYRCAGLRNCCAWPISLCDQVTELAGDRRQAYTGTFSLYL